MSEQHKHYHVEVWMGGEDVRTWTAAGEVSTPTGHATTPVWSFIEANSGKRVTISGQAALVIVSELSEEGQPP